MKFWLILMYTIEPKAFTHLNAHTYTVSILIHPKDVLLGWDQSNWHIHVFMDLALCAVMLEQERAIFKLFQQMWSSPHTVLELTWRSHEVWQLTLQKVGQLCVLCSAASTDATLWFFLLVCHFVAELLLFSVASTLLQYYQLLIERKFLGWT